MKHSVCQSTLTWTSLLLLSLLISACATRSPRDLPSPREIVESTSERIQRAPEKDELRPGYLIALRHSVDPKLNVSVRIERDGKIKLPYGRQLKVDGMTTSLLAEELKKLYKDMFHGRHQFNVDIRDKKLWVETRGLIKKPGFKLIDEGTSLEELQRLSDPSLNGEESQIDYARIEWDGRQQWIDLKQYSAGLWPIDKMPVWIGGEAIWFVRGQPQLFKGANDIRILGEVSQPGSYTFQSGRSFLDYLSLAGGPRPSANLEQIYLFRHGVESEGPAEFSLLRPINFQLAPGDTLLIVSDRPGLMERRVQMTASLATILSALGILLIAL